MSRRSPARHVAARKLHAGAKLLKNGQPEDALRCYTEVLSKNPSSNVALLGFGKALLQSGDPRRALGALTKLLERDPTSLPGLVALAAAQKQLQRPEEAAASLERVLQRKPSHAEAHYRLGGVLLEQGKLVEAIDRYRNAASLEKKNAHYWYALGHAFATAGQVDDAEHAYERSLTLNGNQWHVHWARARNVPLVHRDTHDVEESARRATQGLGALAERAQSLTPASLAKLSAGILDNFHVHYLGTDPLSIQKTHGALVHRAMSAAFPQWSQKLAPRVVDGRIRVGFASSHIRNHTVLRLFERWMTDLDRDEFEVFVYQLGARVDSDTQRIQHAVEHVHYEPGNVGALASKISDDQLHALIYPEVGMDPHVLRLAALRLAPVQAMSCGHPITSGLPTMDVMLSGELVETEDAEQHYTEALVRLPNLGLALSEDPSLASDLSHADFGVDDASVVYLSGQSLFKYLPQHDDVFPRIAEQVPRAKFVFIANKSEDATTLFQTRLQTAFLARGLSADDFCIVLARQPRDRFQALMEISDIFLDTFEFGAGQTAIEAIGRSLVPITCPGTLARSRYTAAALKRIDVTDTIASSKEDYIDLCVKLGHDSDHRNQLREAITAQRSRLFHDEEAMNGFIRFLRDAAEPEPRCNPSG